MPKSRTTKNMISNQGRNAMLRPFYFVALKALLKLSAKCIMRNGQLVHAVIMRFA